MSPHYDRHSESSESSIAEREIRGNHEDAAIDDAAQALREAEVEAVQPTVPTSDWQKLEQMSIDELRKLAADLDVPNRGQIVEQDELIAAIRQRLVERG
jgi:hypothetical protein